MTAIKNLTLKKTPSQFGTWQSGTFEADGQTFKVEAKIYSESSFYGIGEEQGLTEATEGRVSKLWIATPGNWQTRTVIFEYDRDYEDDLTEEYETHILNVVTGLVQALEAKFKAS